MPDHPAVDPADAIGPLDPNWQRNLARANRELAASLVASAEAREHLADTLDAEANTPV